MTADYGDRFRLDGKTAIVTGASHGIGLACARRLARNGSEVLLVGRTAKTLEEARSDLKAEGLKVRSVVCDVTDRDALPSMINTLPQLDILVNNAGGNRPTPFLDVTREDFDWLVDLNVPSLFFASQAAIRKMIQLGTKGSVVNMSSQSGHVGLPKRNRLLPHQTRDRRVHQGASTGSCSIWYSGQFGGTHLRAYSHDGSLFCRSRFR